MLLEEAGKGEAGIPVILIGHKVKLLISHYIRPGSDSILRRGEWPKYPGTLST